MTDRAAGSWLLERPSLHLLVSALNAKLRHSLSASHASKHDCTFAKVFALIKSLPSTVKPLTAWYPFPKHWKVVVVVVVVDVVDVLVLVLVLVLVVVLVDVDVLVGVVLLEPKR